MRFKQFKINTLFYIIAIKIYSSTGLLIESENLKDNSVLYLSHLGSGVYIIKIISKNVLGSKTIIIE